jgi:hypothetical protein
MTTLTRVIKNDAPVQRGQFPFYHDFQGKYDTTVVSTVYKYRT